MKKIVVFLGGPRKNGYTTILANAAAKAAEEKGADVVTFSLNEIDIRGCQGCNYCRTHEDGCAVTDSLTPMYTAIADADAIIFASPIYYYQITGQAKTWLDRTYPFIGSGGTARHPGKTVLGFYAHGEADPNAYTDVIQYVNTFFGYYGWDIQENILVSGTTQEGYALPATLLEQARAAGAKLAT